jgi:hypothetical protein
MKTLGTLMIATTFLAGCVVNTASNTCNDPGSITLYWTFTDATGKVLGCKAAGVDTLVIDIDGERSVQSCIGVNGVEGIRLHNFYPGVYAYSMSAYSGGVNGQLMYMTESKVNAAGCGDNPVDVSLDATQADLFIDYSFAGKTSCTTAGVEQVGYGLVDSYGNTVIADSIPCSSQYPFIRISALPFGSYKLRWIQGQSYDPGSSQYVAMYQKCGVAISHFTADAKVVDMPATTSMTPACQ